MCIKIDHTLIISILFIIKFFEKFIQIFCLAFFFHCFNKIVFWVFVMGGETKFHLELHFSHPSLRDTGTQDESSLKNEYE
ncbi:MAG TPA: hypothetical protein DDZ83_06210 [Nitrospinae bacterium]|nr:hypothetical protein [Nitrospinota bacterium]